MDFVDYVATVPNTKQQQMQVLNYTKLLCQSLQDHFKQYSIKSHNRSIVNALDKGDTSMVQYYEDRIQELKNGEGLYEYEIVEGKKYYKIVMVCPGDYRSKSVHAFVDKNNGNVYKSATFKSPAKGVRYNLLDESSREYVLANCDWSGSYLYQR